MDDKKGIFTVKLYELDQRYEQMRSRILLYQQADHWEIRTELRRVKDACEEDERKLQKSVRSCRLPAVAALAGVQREYIEKARDVLERHVEQYRFSSDPKVLEDRAEAAALYAEYAFDLAIQAIDRAQFAALSAIDLQMTMEEATQEE